MEVKSIFPNPCAISEAKDIEWVEEPPILATIFVPSDYVGGVLKLAQDRRGVQKHLQYLSSTKVMLAYEFPLNETGLWIL